LIKKITNFTVKELKDKGLISLYLAGTILTKDRTPYSDIDLFGIVTSDFQIIKEENKINKIFKKQKKNLCKGIETKFRAIAIDELEGAKPRGIVAKFIGLNNVIKQFPYYKLLYGKKLDFSKFPIKPLELKEQAKKQIKALKTSIKHIKEKKEKFPIQDFSKHILILARIEAEKDYGFKFDPSYKKLTQHLAKQREHIAHKAMKLRYKKVTRKEILDLSKELESYIRHLKKKW